MNPRFNNGGKLVVVELGRGLLSKCTAIVKCPTLNPRYHIRNSLGRQYSIETSLHLHFDGWLITDKACTKNTNLSNSF